MIHAKVIEIAPGGFAKARGEHEFLQLPSPKDRLTLPNPRGTVHTMEVLYTQHAPSPVDKSNSVRRRSPEALVFVQEIESYWDPRWPRSIDVRY